MRQRVWFALVRLAHELGLEDRTYLGSRVGYSAPCVPVRNDIPPVTEITQDLVVQLPSICREEEVDCLGMERYGGVCEVGVEDAADRSRPVWSVEGEGRR